MNMLRYMFCSLVSFSTYDLAPIPGLYYFAPCPLPADGQM